MRIKVRPYYLFHCDPVIGAGHFRTSVWKGLEIMEGLRGHMSGLGIPTYVVDSPHGGGKIPLMPNYLVSASDDAVVLRNYEGMLVRYQAEDKPHTVQPHRHPRREFAASGDGKSRSCPRTTSEWPGAGCTSFPTQSVRKADAPSTIELSAAPVTTILLSLLTHSPT